MKKLMQAKYAKLKNAQHFGTDVSLIKKLEEKFGPEVTIGDLLHFRLSDFMKSGFTGKQTERIVKYLSFYGHRLPEYAYANKRSKQTNVLLYNRHSYKPHKLKLRHQNYPKTFTEEMENKVAETKADLERWEQRLFNTKRH